MELLGGDSLGGDGEEFYDKVNASLKKLKVVLVNIARIANAVPVSLYSRVTM